MLVGWFKYVLFIMLFNCRGIMWCVLFDVDKVCVEDEVGVIVLM